MHYRDIYEELKRIEFKYKGRGDFDENTMFNVARDAEKAKRLIKPVNEAHRSLAILDKAIAYSNSTTKEEDTTKKLAVGTLEDGIAQFLNKA
mgnify:CR=1 FL=1